MPYALDFESITKIKPKKKKKKKKNKTQTKQTNNDLKKKTETNMCVRFFIFFYFFILFCFFYMCTSFILLEMPCDDGASRIRTVKRRAMQSDDGHIENDSYIKTWNNWTITFFNFNPTEQSLYLLYFLNTFHCFISLFYIGKSYLNIYEQIDWSESLRVICLLPQIHKSCGISIRSLSETMVITASILGKLVS